jgi:medium-chain acyl-[acyl-carrier-protein] hydrolase
MGPMGLKPELIFISASRPPSLPILRRVHDLSDDKFDEELRHLAGTPEEILSDASFMSMFRPLLRADFTMDETYENSSLIDIPMIVIGALEDQDTDFDSLTKWTSLTSGPSKVYSLKGDHFYIKTSETEVINIVKTELLGLTALKALRRSG